MKRKIRILDIFIILSIFVILTIIVCLFSVRKIKTTLDKSQEKSQDSIFSEYIGESMNYDDVCKLIDCLSSNIENKFKEPDLVPDIEFYGKENNNIKIIYRVEDSNQSRYYIDELKNIKNTIKNDEKYYVAYPDSEKIVIEYNY